MGKLDDLKRSTNTKIMALQAKAVFLEQRAVNLQTFHDTHQQNITNVPKNNRHLAILIALINNKSNLRQQLLERIDLIEAKDVGDRIAEIENEIDIIQRIENRY
jgi:hypothetical protein